MNRMRGLFALALSLWLGGHWLGPGQVLAEDAPGASVPDLVGIWIGPFKVIRPNGTGEGTFTLRVLSQDGPRIMAEKSWETPGATGRVRGKAIEKATEALVGVIDFDGKTIYLAEHDDNGHHFGRLTAPDTLELIYIEAGHATAFRARLVRQK